MYLINMVDSSGGFMCSSHVVDSNGRLTWLTGLDLAGWFEFGRFMWKTHVADWQIWLVGMTDINYAHRICLNWRSLSLHWDKSCIWCYPINKTYRLWLIGSSLWLRCLNWLRRPKCLLYLIKVGVSDYLLIDMTHFMARYIFCLLSYLGYIASIDTTPFCLFKYHKIVTPE